MNRNFLYLVGLSLSIFILFELFAYSTHFKSKDKLHQEQFNIKYGIFAIIKPQKLNFSGEEVPIYSSEIWERIDKQLLKNIYWQSNTMLYFKKANKYFPIIEPILEKYNIPDDFKYLAIIESGLENVISPSGAAGFWQIMKNTGREYELEINNAVDERYNLEKATIAACKYLQDSYNKFGNWTMTAASYNMGRNGVRKKIIEQSSNNYYNLYLNSETSQYIFRIIAIKEIMENPRMYGFIFRSKDLYYMPEYISLKVDSTIPNLSDFAISHGINYKILKQFNPWLRTTSLPDKSRRMYILKIPINTDLMVFDNIPVKSDF